MISSLKRLVPRSLHRYLWARADRWITARGYVRFDTRNCYAEDGLYTVHNQSFRNDPRFREAYARGVQASEGVDPHFEWRLHISLWAAATALGAAGDFVECGVNAGFMSSAILRYLNWVSIPRTYYLVDTFAGPLVEQFSPAELARGKREQIGELLSAGAYVTDLDRIRRNFAEWPNTVIVQGEVPDVLPGIPVEQVAFLHIDMNCAAPECAALEYFWGKLSKGAVVLMDDYANYEYLEQQKALDDTARALGARVLSLPTGQGLIVR